MDGRATTTALWLAVVAVSSLGRSVVRHDSIHAVTFGDRLNRSSCDCALLQIADCESAQRCVSNNTVADPGELVGVQNRCGGQR